MNISLELYKTFYYVAKNKSISRAANELLISQPAVSKSIKTLEEQLDAKLFIRNREGMELTDAGNTLYIKIKDAMELISSAENDLNSMTSMESGVLNINTSDTIMLEHLMPVIIKFHKDYPNILLKISGYKTSDALLKLQKGLLDIIITYFPFPFPDNIKYESLLPLHDCLAGSNSFEHLKNKKINPEDLEKEPIIQLNKGSTVRTKFDNYCVKTNIHVFPVIELGNNAVLKAFALSGFGIGMFTEEYIKDELDKGDLFKLDLKIPFEEKSLVIASIKGNNSLMTNNFIEYVKNNINY